MRNVTTLTDVPTRQEIRERIPNSARFQPQPTILRPPEIRQREDGQMEVYFQRSGSWRRIHPMLVEVTRGLEAGDTLARLSERAFPLCPRPSRRVCDYLVRNYIWRLHRDGQVDIPLEAPPAVFGGRYRRVMELGRGGMGVVHLCEDEHQPGVQVVVKHAWGWTKPIEKAEVTIRKEAAVLAHLDHPLVPGLRDAFEVEGLLHIVRGFAPGKESHRHRLSDASSAHRLRVLRDMALALQHVHERGFLYLDAKPGNFIMSGPDAAPMLLDFGIARPYGEDGIVHLKTGIGSRGFAAPEVVRERHATVRSDVFSLGRVHVELATGHSPKTKWTDADMRDVLDAANVEPRERDLIVRMCATDPQARPATMGDVARIAGA